MSEQDASFRWSTSDGTAISAAGDYLAVDNQLVTIDAGSLSGTSEVAIYDDELHEVSENFLVNIAQSSLIGIAPEGSILQARVDIADNDNPPFLTISSIQIDEGIGRAILGYTLSSASGQDTRFLWSTSNETASGTDGDFTAVSNQLVTIAAGDTDGTLGVLITDDNYHELDEYFTVDIHSATLSGIDTEGSVLQARIDILDNDPLPSLRLESAHVLEGEGQVSISYSLSAPSQVESQFTWSTQDGSAISTNGDYTSVGGTREVINQSDTSGELVVLIGDDLFHEAEEYFILRLSSFSEIDESLSDQRGESHYCRQ